VLGRALPWRPLRDERGRFAVGQSHRDDDGREHGVAAVDAYMLASVAIDLGSARSWTCRTSSWPPTARCRSST